MTTANKSIDIKATRENTRPFLHHHKSVMDHRHYSKFPFDRGPITSHRLTLAIPTMHRVN